MPRSTSACATATASGFDGERLSDSTVRLPLDTSRPPPCFAPRRAVQPDRDRLLRLVRDAAARAECAPQFVGEPVDRAAGEEVGGGEEAAPCLLELADHGFAILAQQRIGESILAGRPDRPLELTLGIHVLDA